MSTSIDSPRFSATEEACVPQLVSRRAAETPGAIALAAGTDALSYGELEARANLLASHLRSLGVGRETVVGLCIDRSIAMVVGALGILKAGGAYLPIDPAYPGARIAFTLQDAQTPVLVTQQCITASLPSGPWEVVGLDRNGALPLPCAGGQPVDAAGPDDLAYVIYTSGSTGQPKGVQITHRSLANLVSWHQRAFDVAASDRATQVASPGFDAAVWEIWPYLTAGASLHLPGEYTRISPEALRDWLVAERITISFLPTPLAERVLQLDWPAGTGLRYLLTGGDTLHHHPSPKLPFVLVNNYGPTECTVVATSQAVRPEEQANSLPPIGRPIDNTQIYILDDDLKPVSDGQSGEIYVAGAGVARGYLNRPELSAARFLRNPFSADPGARMYKTGDLGHYLPDGQIAFLGRADEQVKIRGYRIEPDGIATVLEKHPAVQSAVVTAREDAGSEKRLVAYIVPAAGAEAGEAELREFVQARMPEYMVPAVFVTLESLPVTPNGKVDRAALPAPDESNTLRGEPFVAPRNTVEERLAAIVANLLGLKQVGVNDNFFLLGGHSLLGTQLIARVLDAFGVELPLRTLFEAPTLAELSLEIEQLIIEKIEAMSDDDVRRILE